MGWTLEPEISKKGLSAKVTATNKLIDLFYALCPKYSAIFLFTNSPDNTSRQPCIVYYFLSHTVKSYRSDEEPVKQH